MTTHCPARPVSESYRWRHVTFYCVDWPKSARVSRSVPDLKFKFGPATVTFHWQAVSARRAPGVPAGATSEMGLAGSKIILQKFE